MLFQFNFFMKNSALRVFLALLLVRLPIAVAQAEANLAAWPVPAHDVLHLRLVPSLLRVALLDASGREVLTQNVAAGQTALTLPVAGLPPGAYLLRVAYPSSLVLRRVAVE